MYKRKCKIIFICHGATIYSEDNRLFDNPNYPPLNMNGRYEVEKITEWLIKRVPKVDAIYCASSLRAIQSAKIVSKKYSMVFDVVDGLMSKRNGLFNGLNFEQIETLYPELLDEYHENRADFCPSGGESLREFDLKVEEIIKNLVSQNFGKRIFVIAHPDIIQAVIRSALDIPIDNQTRIYIPTGSATQVNYYSEWESLVYSGYLPL